MSQSQRLCAAGNETGKLFLSTVNRYGGYYSFPKSFLNKPHDVIVRERGICYLIIFTIFTEIKKLDKNTNIDHEFHKKVVKYIEETEHDYFSTHTKICFFIVSRIYHRVLKGYGSKFGGIKIDTTNKLIIDGNHRYIAFKLANFNFETIEWTKNHSDPLNNINNINLIISEDWDENCPKNKKYCTDEFLADL